MAERHPNHRELAALPRELRRTTVPPAARAWVGRVAGADVTAWRRLPGASTSAVHALRLADGRRVVLRRWTWRFVLDDEPVVARREVDALAYAAAAGLPAPRVVAADLTGDDVGDGVPALVTTHLPGRAVGTPCLRALAAGAAAIHEVRGEGFPHAFFRWCVGALAGPPPAARRPDLWERALVAREALLPAYGERFVHRDYHPGNVLWTRGRLSGVVDWPNACRGPWECDVATCRRNLSRLAGPAAAERFLDAYLALTGWSYDPYWDLNHLLEEDADHWTASEVAEAEPELDRLLAELGA